MTAKEFKTLLQQTGVKQQDVVLALGAHQPTLVHYASGVRPIPETFVQAAVPFIYKLTQKRARAGQAALEKYAPLAASRQSTTRKAG